MQSLEAINIIEGFEEGDQVEAFQSLIDSGVVWQLQGAYGRAARDLIEQGVCTMPETIN